MRPQLQQLLTYLLAVACTFWAAHTAHATPAMSSDPCDLGAPAVVVRFDDRDPRTVLDQQYRQRGVEFGGTAVIDTPAISPRSPSQAARSQSGDLGSAGQPISMTFRKPMATVALYAGRDAPDAVTGSLRARLTAFGVNLYGTTSALAISDVELPAEAAAVDRCLIVTAPPGTTIARATLEYEAHGASSSDLRWMDDLTLLAVHESTPSSSGTTGDLVGLARPPQSAIEAPAHGAGDEAWRWQVALAAFGLTLMLSCFVGWHWQKDGHAVRPPIDGGDPWQRPTWWQ